MQLVDLLIVYLLHTQTFEEMEIIYHIFEDKKEQTCPYTLGFRLQLLVQK